MAEVLLAVFQRGLDLASLLVLDPGFPLIVDKPSGYEVIVIGVETVLPPALGLEVVKEVFTLKNLR